MSVGTSAQHLLCEYHGCDPTLLDDREALERILRRATEAANATVVATTFHRFAPQGVTGVVVLEESHFSIHTWPEAGYAALDFYTCGQCLPERAHEVVQTALGATRSELMSIRRGGAPPGPSMRIERHEDSTAT